jgi:hypothetical protein
VVAVSGDLPVDVVLGLRPVDSVMRTDHVDAVPTEHHDRYVSWSWASTVPCGRAVLERFIEAVPPAVLRRKGSVCLDDGTEVDVDVVGARREVRRSRSAAARADSWADSSGVGSRLVAIALGDGFDLATLDGLAATNLPSGPTDGSSGLDDGADPLRAGPLDHE